MLAGMEEELEISEMGDMLSNSFMGMEKMGPAASSALDLLESTCTVNRTVIQDQL